MPLFRYRCYVKVREQGHERNLQSPPSVILKSNTKKILWANILDHLTGSRHLDKPDVVHS